MFTLELIKGGSDKPLPQSKNFIKKIADSSTIEEEKIFSKGEILGLIEQIAKKENIKSDQLTIAKEVYDKYGNLIKLYAKVKEGRVLGEGWKSIEYIYMIKGERGDGDFSKMSNISRIYNLTDPEASHGGIVAQYKNGKWELTPGKIAPKGMNLTPGKNE